MKKVVLFFATLLAGGALMAQTIVSTEASNRNVIIEEYTGVNCGYCPDGHRIANQICDANEGHAWAINIHQGGYAARYTTQWGDALAAQTGLTGYPSGTVNRHKFSGSVTALSRGSWEQAASMIRNMASPVNVAARGTIDARSRKLTLYVEAYYTGDQTVTSNFLNVAMLQNNVMGPQSGATNFYPEMVVNGQYRHMHMLRDLITGQWGEEITTIGNSTLVTRTYNYTIPFIIGDVPITNLADLDFVVFITESHQEILTGNKVEISLVNEGVPCFSACDILHSSECSFDYQPVITLSNPTDNTVTDWVIEYNGVTNTYAKTIAPGQTDTIKFPAMSMPSVPTENGYVTDSARFRLKGHTNMPEGATPEPETYESDIIPLLLYNEYMLKVDNTIDLDLALDRYASETTVELIDMATCQRVWNVGPFTDLASTGPARHHHYTLSPAASGMYIFRVKDSYGDGMQYATTAPGYTILEGSTQLYHNNGVFGTESHVMVYFTNAGSGTFGIDDVISTVDFNVYPNPVFDRLNIECAAAMREVNVIDMTGRTVITSASADINVSGLAAGVYMVRVATDNGVGMQKFVKE